MLINLAYGKTGLEVNLPEKRTTVIEPNYLPGLPDEAEVLLRALRNPINKPPLKSLVSSDQTVAISVCDITRPMPSSRVLPILLQELKNNMVQLGCSTLEELRGSVTEGTS